MKVKTLFDRAVTCAKVLPYLANSEVREHLNRVSHYSRIASQYGSPGAGIFGLQMIAAGQRTIARSCYWLGNFFKERGVPILAQSYMRDWGYWMNRIRQTTKRIKDHEYNNPSPTHPKKQGGGDGGDTSEHLHLLSPSVQPIEENQRGKVPQQFRASL